MRIEHLSCVTEEEIIRIDGFAEHSAGIIVAELKEMRPGIEQMLETDFNLEETYLLSESQAIQLPMAGMKIVFKGKMLQASRDQMKKRAMQLGASVQSTVSAKTDMLVCWENVGAAKMNKAEKLGVHVVTEAEYVELQNSHAEN